MEMDFNEFLSLSSIHKCIVVSNEGTYIAAREKDEQTFNLYSIFCYYVEICFNLKDNCVVAIQLFENMNELDPYLEEIHLPSLGIV